MLQLGETKNNEKATLSITEGSEKIVFQFNPNEYELSDNVAYEKTRKCGKREYIANNPRTFTLSFYLDTPINNVTKEKSNDANSVQARVKKIRALLQVDAEKHRPPDVCFEWGDIKFVGLITSIKTTFTQFTSEGIAIRAKVDMSIEEESIQKKSKVTHSPDRTKTRVLSEDTSIWTLAKNEYGDMNEWRRIAKANHILNPFDIETGQIIEVPAIVAED